jgi:hypothetical protein
VLEELENIDFESYLASQKTAARFFFVNFELVISQFDYNTLADEKTLDLKNVTINFCQI